MGKIIGFRNLNAVIEFCGFVGQSNCDQTLNGIAPAIPEDVLSQAAVPAEFSLAQNYPNPFNPNTRIEYKLAIREYVRLNVYNMLGQEVATLVDGVRDAGTYNAEWNASGVPSGIYWYRIDAGNFSETRKMILMKVIQGSLNHD